MSLHLHRAVRADRLVAALAGLLIDPLPDPFATEVVVVPTRGVERWLAQSLSQRLGRTEGAAGFGDGVCAGVAFWSPGRLSGEVTAAITGIERAEDPWTPQHSVWPLLQIITEARREPWAAPIWRYLHSGDQQGGDQQGDGEPDVPNAVHTMTGARRYSSARHLAELLHRYATDRPGLLAQWQRGLDLDPGGRPLPPELAWQAEAFRRLRARLGQPGPAERLASVCSRLAAEPQLSSLPGRISVFGATRLRSDQLELIMALAEHRELHLWLPHPSPALWRSVANATTDPPVDQPIGPRAADPTADLPRHRLLAYLGRDVRECQLLLARHPIADDTDHDQDNQNQPNQDQHEGQPDDLDLLHRLQRDIADDRALAAPTPQPRLGPEDHSVSVHASHGPDRQVEVLRELLLNRLQDDPSLEPRDIVVMCPDIETFAPLVSASFGVEAEGVDRLHPGHRLRVRLADRSLRRINPLLAVLGQLFDLAESRLEATTLLDLCSSVPVATKFGLSEDDLLRLRDLVGRAGVRWGRDAGDRGRFAMAGFAQNTWAAGLDRLFLGVAMDEEGEHFLGTTLPLDDVDSGDVDALGQLAEIISRIGGVLDGLAGLRTLSAWIELCRDALESLTAVPAGESWQLAQAYTELARIGAGGPADGPVLTRSEIRLLLAESFGGRPSRANFRTGTLTMCTMMPMRTVPHRIVCLLGLDDGVFPRAGRPDGDDVLAADPWIGDRDPRSEDRQLMLDAIMSATDELMVIYAGADPRTNAVKPPSVPVGELLDVLDLTARAATGGRAREQILHRHPLQPFDPRNFVPESGPGQTAKHPFSFDRAGLAGAKQLWQTTGSARPNPPEQSGRTAVLASVSGLPAFELPETVELADLIRFLHHPARAFLRTRAGLSGWTGDAEPPDEIPIALDGLQAWAIGDRMLELQLRGIDIGRAVDAEWRRGSLPPRQLGTRTLNPVADRVAGLGALAGPYLSGERRQFDVRLPLEPNTGHRSLAGTITSVVGDRLVSVGYSRLAAKHRLRAWVELLALSAARPTTAWQAVTIGRGGRSILGPVPPETSTILLSDLVDLYRSGLQAPLPLPIQTAAEYAELRRRGRSVELFAPRLEQTWARERDSAFATVWGSEPSLVELMAEPSIAAEVRGSCGEPSRLGTLARRVWQPLLDSETLDNP